MSHFSRSAPMRASLLAVAILAATLARGISVADAAWDAVRFDGDYYWTMNYVVLARVVEARKFADPSGDRLDTVIARPMGTLSGGFDAGKTPRITIRGFQAANGLHTGDVILAAMHDHLVAAKRPNTEAVYYTEDGPFPYMPHQFRAIEVVSGFADETVQETRAAIQKLRRKPEVKSGDTPQYWESHSVVFAEAETFAMAGTHAASYVFLIRGTLSGGYDPGKMPRLSLVLDFDAEHSVLDERAHAIEPGDKMLLLLKRGGSDGEWHFPIERAAFMPFCHDPMILAERHWNPQPRNTALEAIGSTLTEIQKRRPREGGGAAVSPHEIPPTRK
jgi:hypothetical protein